ncbi:protein masquerade-like [Paramacrobiotus metropolitanus]|uniref:protein masquerade-like n=1 Tax=Paramacrobiotus metropolitanus TaxID=2943436 RepID=UPI00244582B4|nr:protein masquerade-like [Paramacrobiotus metropolitanus]
MELRNKSAFAVSISALLIFAASRIKGQFIQCCSGASCGSCQAAILQSICLSDAGSNWIPNNPSCNAGDGCCIPPGGGVGPVTTQNPFQTTLPWWLTTTQNPFFTTAPPWWQTTQPWWQTTPFNPFQTTLFPGQQGICSGRIVRSSSVSASGVGVSVFGEASAGDSQIVSQFIRGGTDSIFNVNINDTKISRVKRIVGGEPAVDGHLCYQVAIILATNQQLVATGALIADNYVLTSYSSILRADPTGNNLRLILGGKASVIPQFGAPANTAYRVIRVIQHPNFMQRYGPGFPINDVALLQIDTTSQPVQPNTVCKLCLAPVVPELRRVFVSGYGSQAENVQVPDGILRRVSVPLIPKPVCQNVFKTIFPQNFVFDANSMCAGGEPGRDTCNKDGGAPLVGEDFQNNRFLLGVSSWGYGCGRAGYPGVYTNVTSVASWIGSVTSFLTISGPSGNG